MLSFIDFAPTILSIANIDIPKIYQGKPFLGFKKSLEKRKYLFTASDRFDELTDRIRAVKSKKFKYIRNYNTEKPHALNVVYRTQMNLMKHLNELNKTNNYLLYDLKNQLYETYSLFFKN